MTRAPRPEWAPHKAVWIGFPSHPELWQEDLDQARDEVVAFAAAVHADGKGEQVLLVAANDEAADAARAMAPFATVIVELFGDIWLRDTGPIIGADGTANSFLFNGWAASTICPAMTTSAFASPPSVARRRRGTIGCWRAGRSTATAPASSSAPNNVC